MSLTPVLPGTPGSPPESELHLRISDLSRVFGTVPAVDGVSLDIGRGEFFAILGPSGCGKTTLLRMLAGFERPSSGRMELDGMDLTAVPPHRRPVNMMFQNYALFPHMSVARNVGFGLRQEGLPRAEIATRVAEALAMVRLDGFGDRRPDRLSGGQRQRVALARALVKRPRLLLLDEPLAALDRRLREQTRFELLRLQKEVGITFVIVTHDQEEAMLLADRIAVMDRGRIVQLGPPREVYRHPGSRFVAEFIGEVNLFDAEPLPDGRAVSDLGELRLAAVPPGERFWVAVRPEMFELNTEPTIGGGAVRGIVTEVGYLGEITIVHVRTTAGRMLTVRSANSPAAPAGQLAPGDAVTVSWRPEALVVLPS